MGWLPAIVTAPPLGTVITPEEARRQANIEEDDDSFDPELAIFIDAAVRHAEDYTGLKLLSQTVQMKCGHFCDLARLPIGPVSAVTAVKYLDADGAEQTLAMSVWEESLAGLEAQVRLKANQAWPTPRCVEDAVRVTATVGYADAVAIPAPIRQAILLLVGSWFRDRENSAADRLQLIPNGAADLLQNYRI